MATYPYAKKPAPKPEVKKEIPKIKPKIIKQEPKFENPKPVVETTVETPGIKDDTLPLFDDKL